MYMLFLLITNKKEESEQFHGKLLSYSLWSKLKTPEYFSKY